ncbi:MAG: peptidase M50 [Pseudomonadota bacterium]
MAESLFSESWYRVADLKPRLRSHAQIHRHTYRGTDWYVLEDHASGRCHRFSGEAYAIIGLMDGRRALNEIWEAACARLGDDMPTQEEVIRLLSQLYQADVLQSDMPPDIADLHRRHQLEKRNRLVGQLKSPFAIRIPLFDPDRFLSDTQFLVRPLFGWLGLTLWTLAVVSALMLAGIHWEALTAGLADRVFALENLFLLWLAYPVIKALHEFGHAYTVKRWGGEVHDMGIMLLVFMPVPYVDATASSAFPGKYRRMAVGGAGILTEMFLAALAMWVWVAVEPGAVRALAFNVIVIAGVSTLFFNGNPLLRFDAYYVFSDFLEIPNLAGRANQYVGYLFKRYLVGIDEVKSPATADGEAPWLAFYGIAAFVYRLFIMIRIAMYVAGKFFAVGVGLAAWGLFSVLVLPLYQLCHHAVTDLAMQRRRGRVLAIVGGSAAALILMLLALPVPSFTVVEGVLWTPAFSQVVAGSDGFVQRIAAAAGQPVPAGALLIACDNPELDAEAAVLAAQLREYEARQRLSVTLDRIEADILADEVARIRAELDEKMQEKEHLNIRSPSAGVFFISHPEDWPRRFARRGMTLGTIVDFSQVTARIVVPQGSVDQVRRHTRRVSAMRAGAIGRELPAQVIREVPAASADLPSLALSLEGGGALALDPRENKTPKAFENLFHFEVHIAGLTRGAIGERVYVRFEHDPEPLAYRLYRSIRRTLLSQFNV